MDAGHALNAADGVTFNEAADLSGISLSSWVRERLRITAIRELEGAGVSVPFVGRIPLRSQKDA